MKRAQLANDHCTKSAAERMRDLRARNKAGLIPVQVEIEEVSVTQMLIAGGFLVREDEDDRKKIGEACGRFLNAAAVIP